MRTDAARTARRARRAAFLLLGGVAALCALALVEGRWTIATTLLAAVVVGELAVFVHVLRAAVRGRVGPTRPASPSGG